MRETSGWTTVILRMTSPFTVIKETKFLLTVKLEAVKTDIDIDDMLS